MRVVSTIDSSHWPEIWQSAYRLLEQNLASNTLQMWIKPLEFVGTEKSDQGYKVFFAAEHQFTANWVRDHYKREIEQAFSTVLGTHCELQVDLKPKKTHDIAHENISEPLQNAETSMHHSSLEPEIAPQTATSNETAVEESQLDTRYTFENFVVGASNNFAYASAIAVAEQPGRLYNPLFLFSHPGLGKTHLLHAIGNHILKTNPKSRVKYVWAESLMNEFIESLQKKRMPEFRKKYRDTYDVILIDDIHSIAGKEGTEEEFFHTFNALYQSRRQIVMTSDRPPKEIEKLAERLRTRFEWGLVSPIAPPEIETRIAILKNKAEQDNIYLPDDVAMFLATYVKSNVRELEGTLIKLKAHASLMGAEISLEMAKHELQSFMPEEGSHYTIDSILQAVAKYYGLKLSEFKSESRVRSIALPRQVAMYLIRKYTPLNLKEIANYFGGKDHSTVLHAIKKIELALETDSKTRESVEAIQNQL